VTQHSQYDMEGNADHFDQPGTAHVMYASSKKKAKKLSSITMYNNIRGESELIANIASSDTLQTYHNVMTLLRYVQANIQNKSGHDLKEAVATYLNITNFGSTFKILPSSRERTAGKMATKRKHRSVEVATAGKEKHCFFCKSKEHNDKDVIWRNQRGNVLLP